jgi:hypothetical protein
MKNKFLIVGLISLMMVAGLVLSCKKDEPCCTAAEMDKWTDITQAPKCCQDAMARVDALFDSSGNLLSGKTEADVEAAAGCCLAAAKEAGW